MFLPKAWIQNRKREYYYRKAKAEQYRSRSTYKLSQTAKTFHFINRGNIVVDLGAAPGGWIQAARKIVGKTGFVLGVDLKPIEPFTYEYVRTIVADMREPDVQQQIQSFLPRKADVVISDASPISSSSDRPCGSIANPGPRERQAQVGDAPPPPAPKWPG